MKMRNFKKNIIGILAVALAAGTVLMPCQVSAENALETVIPETIARTEAEDSTEETMITEIETETQTVQESETVGQEETGETEKLETAEEVIETEEETQDALSSTDPVKAFVGRFYLYILGREADASGLEAWTNNLKSGKEDGVAVGAGFIESAEFKGRNLSDEEYIKVLYKAFFDREADSSGLESWKKVLNEGLTRRQVYRGFAESQEFAKICSQYHINQGKVVMSAYKDQNEGVTKFVYRCYSLCLGRIPDEGGLEGWCKAIITGSNTAKQAAYGFVYSDEFKNRNFSDEEYVEILYRVFMGREADGAGLNAWVNVLQERSRLHVFNGFADSQEFRDLCAGYGINPGEVNQSVATTQIVKSSRIGAYNGVIYTCNKTVDGMQRLPVQAVKYDYISTFAFYNGRLYYCCKESGTSGFGMALISCNPDGSDVKILCDSPFRGNDQPQIGCQTFTIANGNIYYGYNYSSKTMQCTNLNNGVTSEVRASSLGSEITGNTVYSEEEGYYVKKKSLYRVVEGLGAVRVYQGSYYLSRVQAVVGENVYFTGYHSQYGDLYCYNMSTGNTEMIASHQTAGGGDPFFNE